MAHDPRMVYKGCRFQGAGLRACRHPFSELSGFHFAGGACRDWGSGRVKTSRADSVLQDGEKELDFMLDIWFCGLGFPKAEG